MFQRVNQLLVCWSISVDQDLRYLCSTKLAFLLPTTCVSDAPPPLNSHCFSGATNNTDWQVTEVTFHSWPSLPHRFTLLYGRAWLTIIYAERSNTQPSLDVLELRHSVEEFCENIEAEYPPPGFAPANSKQKYIDVQTCTQWINGSRPVPLAIQMPTALALTALTDPSTLLGRYGPASVSFLVEDPHGIYTDGVLVIRSLIRSNRASSLAHEDGVLQTSWEAVTGHR